MRVSAPTSSLRKIATASAWSFGASGVVLGIGGGAAEVDRPSLLLVIASPGGARACDEQCPAAGAPRRDPRWWDRLRPRQRHDGPRATCSPRRTPPSRARD